ncbi:RlpA-like double-psi beta-barrel-protein domain-containing protein-containing protein, partial [Paraphysoderma sedebokerense]
TFYDPGLGACEVTNSGSDFIGAMNHIDFGTFPRALNSPVCHSCVNVCGSKGCQIIQITDKCPGCKKGDLDLSPVAFKKIDDPDRGRVRIKWTYVECDSGKELPGPKAGKPNYGGNYPSNGKGISNNPPSKNPAKKDPKEETEKEPKEPQVPLNPPSPPANSTKQPNLPRKRETPTLGKSPFAFPIPSETPEPPPEATEKRPKSILDSFAFRVPTPVSGAQSHDTFLWGILTTGAGMVAFAV